MRLEEIKQKKALPATADASQNLDKPVPLRFYQPVKVKISLYFHGTYFTTKPILPSTDRFHFYGDIHLKMESVANHIPASTNASRILQMLTSPAAVTTICPQW
jgi:hypothetical protein